MSFLIRLSSWVFFHPVERGAVLFSILPYNTWKKVPITRHIQKYFQVESTRRKISNPNSLAAPRHSVCLSVSLGGLGAIFCAKVKCADIWDITHFLEGAECVNPEQFSALLVGNLVSWAICKRAACCSCCCRSLDRR